MDLSSPELVLGKCHCDPNLCLLPCWLKPGGKIQISVSKVRRTFPSAQGPCIQQPRTSARAHGCSESSQGVRPSPACLYLKTQSVEQLGACTFKGPTILETRKCIPHPCTHSSATHSQPCTHSLVPTSHSSLSLPKAVTFPNLTLQSEI